MATSATFGRGTKLQVEDSPAAGTYHDIPECKNIGPPNQEPEEEDVTNQDSAGASKEFVRTGIDFGEVTTDCNYLPDDSDHQQLIDDAQAAAQVDRNWRILLVGGTRSIDFAGWVRTFARELPHDGVYKANLRIRVTGQPVENPSP